MLSKSIKYGILAIVYLAREQGDKYLPISKISKEIKVPFPYLNKIYLQLSEKGIIDSKKGRKGGVRLIKSVDELFLIEIVDAIRKKLFISNEGTDLDINRDEYDLILKEIDLNTNQKMFKYFESISIESILNNLK